MFNNRRVEEDLERIRRANLPPEVFKAEDEEKRRVTEVYQTAKYRVTFKNIFAMTIAVLSLILPYAIILIAVMVVFMYLFVR